MARFFWGAVLLARPDSIRLGRAATSGERAVIRVLGARHLMQAVFLLRRHDDRAAEVSAAIDGVHAASMAVLAAVRSSTRIPALISLAMSGGFGLATSLCRWPPSARR